jgi:hypothetical protein
MRTRSYYVVRSLVRAVFWTGITLVSLYAIQLFILAVWSLQF